MNANRAVSIDRWVNKDGKHTSRYGVGGCAGGHGSSTRPAELDTKGAVESYLARMEALLSAFWPKRCAAICAPPTNARPALDSMARVQVIVPSLSKRLA